MALGNENENVRGKQKHLKCYRGLCCANYYPLDWVDNNNNNEKISQHEQKHRKREQRKNQHQQQQNHTQRTMGKVKKTGKNSIECNGKHSAAL